MRYSFATWLVPIVEKQVLHFDVIASITTPFVQSVPVRETLNGQTVWEGVVHVFDLLDIPPCRWAASSIPRTQ